LAAVAAIHPELQSLNTEVLAISTDSVFSHKKYFDTSEKLKDVRYPVISDRTQQISRAYRVLDPAIGASFRATIIIDPEGTIVSQTVYPDDVGRNIDELKRMIKALRYSKQQKRATPANWQPGESGIRRDHDRIG
jgi:alkyl hydroperoxide reductase subunit AhpC